MTYPAEGECRAVANHMIGQLLRGERTKREIREELQAMPTAEREIVRTWLNKWGANEL